MVVISGSCGECPGPFGNGRGFRSILFQLQAIDATLYHDRFRVGSVTTATIFIFAVAVVLTATATTITADVFTLYQTIGRNGPSLLCDLVRMWQVTVGIMFPFEATRGMDRCTVQQSGHENGVPHGADGQNRHDPRYTDIVGMYRGYRIGWPW